MANLRKTKALKCELGELDQQQKDYMENLAYSLLEIQNASFIKKPETLENDTMQAVQVNTVVEKTLQ
jgi:hypothetical protein